MNNQQITLKSRGIAQCLSFNNGKPEADAKKIILELSHRLDSREINAKFKNGRLLLRNEIGSSRYATFLETISYLISGALPYKI
jgi:hypothetical protein